MREYRSIPIDQLVSDVAVDPAHVKALAASIKIVGPITPVTVRAETLALIDGFHRVAALQELGFSEVDCFVVDCDDETFWDMRITTAVTHKSVTFARAIGWIEEAFKANSLLTGRNTQYKSAYSIFRAVRHGHAGTPAGAKKWVAEKARRWGVAVTTIEQWLLTKENLVPEILEEATLGAGATLPQTTYVDLARFLPKEPELQRQVLEKTKREELSNRQVQQVARAVKQTTDPVGIASILAQPVARTAEELTPNVRAERLLTGKNRAGPIRWLDDIVKRFSADLGKILDPDRDERSAKLRELVQHKDSIRSNVRRDLVITLEQLAQRAMGFAEQLREEKSQ
jgi:hypothetical protein